MARTLYGGSPADVIAQVTTDDGDLAPATATLTAWDSLSGGTQLTDLTTAGGSPITVVTPDALGRVVFYGPNSYVGAIWLQDPTGTRWRIDPADLANRVASVAYGTTAGTAAEGNDSRITGAMQKAANLADVADANVSRGNLGAAAASHTHAQSDVTGLVTDLAAKMGTVAAGGTAGAMLRCRGVYTTGTQPTSLVTGDWWIEL